MNKNKEKPEIYAIQLEGRDWRISRRDFLKAAGTGAAVLGVGLGSRFVRPAFAQTGLDTLCRNSLAHSDTITHLFLSADGNHLVSRDSGNTMKCWDFRNYALTGTVKDAFSKNAPVLTGFIDDRSCVVSSEMQYYELPLTGSSSSKKIKASQSDFGLFTIDAFENIYAVRKGTEILRLKKSDDYSNTEVLYTLDHSAGSIRFLEGSRKLFVQMSGSFGVLDPEKKTMDTFAVDCPVYAIAPGEARVLVCEDSRYRLVSLKDGSVIWEQQSGELNTSQPKLSGAAVTPDGSIGILSGGSSKRHFWLVAMSDGTLLKELETGDLASGNSTQIALSGDGTKFAAAVGKSILFFSLPDLEIIGCPVDLTQMKDTSKGVEIKEVDSVTGKTITYTLPCGAPIPDGAVCVCNCVAGSVCSCVGYTICTCDTVCSCVGNTVCTCDTVCTCNSEGGHYWHPN